MTKCSICGRNNYLGDHKKCTAAREAEQAKLAHADQRAWFYATGHCGACGNPGGYCTCRTPCGCAELHDVGSGLQPDALDQFAEAPPATVNDEQEVLW